MYAVQLTTGQSITVSDVTSGSTPLTYSGPGSGHTTVVLTEQQYYDAINSAAGGLTDVSNPKLPVLHLAIPAAAGLIAQGSFAYCGFSISATAASTLILVDNNGGGTGLQGTAAAAQPIEYISLATGGANQTFYPSFGGPESGLVFPAIPITPGPNGGLAVASPTGTYTGVVRICGR